MGDSGELRTSVPLPGRARDVVVSGVPVRIWGLALACCAVEAGEGLAQLEAAGDSAQPPGRSATSPRLHLLLIAGTVTPALLPQVRTAWQALPEPRTAVAFGACTLSGGPYWDSYAVVPGVLDEFPGAVAVPGCPPRADQVLAAVRTAVRAWQESTRAAL